MPSDDPLALYRGTRLLTAISIRRRLVDQGHRRAAEKVAEWYDLDPLPADRIPDQLGGFYRGHRP